MLFTKLLFSSHFHLQTTRFRHLKQVEVFGIFWGGWVWVLVGLGFFLLICLFSSPDIDSVPPSEELRSNSEFDLKLIKGILSRIMFRNYLYPPISHIIYMSEIVCKIRAAILAPH